MLVEMPVRTIWVMPRRRSWTSRSVPWKALQLCLVTRMSPGWPDSSSTMTSQPSGKARPRACLSVRPGTASAQSGAKETRTRTTGRPRERNASASSAVRDTTSAAGYGSVGMPVMPAWRSIATRAVRGSRVVSDMRGVGRPRGRPGGIAAGGRAGPAGMNRVGPCGPAGSVRYGGSAAVAAIAPSRGWSVAVTEDAPSRRVSPDVTDARAVPAAQSPSGPSAAPPRCSGPGRRGPATPRAAACCPRPVPGRPR